MYASPENYGKMVSFLWYMMKMMMFMREKEVCILCAGFPLVFECERLICREGGCGIERAQEQQKRESLSKSLVTF